MKKKQGSQASSAAAAEKEIVSVETISDIKYLAEKSKKVSDTLGPNETCEIVARFTPSRAGEQNLVANFSCDGISTPVIAKTNKTTVRVIYLIIAEANGEMCFFRIGETGKNKLKVRHDFPVKAKHAKVAWNFKTVCIWLGEEGKGNFARFSPSGLDGLILTIHTGVTALYTKRKMV